MLSFWNGLIGNHAPGVGGYIEDVYLATLFFGTAYALWRSSAVPRPIGNPIQRKSRTLASTLHVFSGAGALAVALYAVVLERVFRESPGWTWMWVTSSLFLVNSLSYGPLMNIFKASKEGKYAMQLGYSFVAFSRGGLDCLVGATRRAGLDVLGGDAVLVFFHRQVVGEHGVLFGVGSGGTERREGGRYEFRE